MNESECMGAQCVGRPSLRALNCHKFVTAVITDHLCSTQSTAGHACQCVPLVKPLPNER